MSKLHVHVFAPFVCDQSQESSQQEIWTPPQQKSEELLVWNPDFSVLYRFLGLIFNRRLSLGPFFPWQATTITPQTGAVNTCLGSNDWSLVGFHM